MYQALFIQKSPNSPKVNFNPQKGIFRIQGCITTNTPEDFFKPVLLWLDGFIPKESKKTEFHFFVGKSDVNCIKRILFVLYKLRKFVQNDHTVRVHWHYNSDNSIMREIGEDLANMVPEIPFHFAKKRINISL